MPNARNGFKKCLKCGLSKPVEEYFLHPKSDSRHNRCLACRLPKKAPSPPSVLKVVKIPKRVVPAKRVNRGNAAWQALKK